jgi:hypothetical protein
MDDNHDDIPSRKVDRRRGPRDPETKKRISEKLTGRRLSEEHRQHISESWTAEQREQVGESLREFHRKRRSKKEDHE